MKYSPADYAKLLIDLEEKTSPADYSLLVKQITNLLSKNNDLNKLKEIEEAYKEIKTKKAGKKLVKIEYCGDLDKQALTQKMDKNLIIDFVENKDLRGGIRIQIGDKRIDSSIKKRLDTLKEIIA